MPRLHLPRTTSSREACREPRKADQDPASVVGVESMLVCNKGEAGSDDSPSPSLSSAPTTLPRIAPDKPNGSSLEGMRTEVRLELDLLILLSALQTPQSDGLAIRSFALWQIGAAASETDADLGETSQVSVSPADLLDDLFGHQCRRPGFLIPPSPSSMSCNGSKILSVQLSHFWLGGVDPIHASRSSIASPPAGFARKSSAGAGQPTWNP